MKARTLRTVALVATLVASPLALPAAPFGLLAMWLWFLADRAEARESWREHCAGERFVTALKAGLTSPALHGGRD